LDGDCIPAALIVRSRRPGDRYGGPGHRKVKKMLIDARIDLEARSKIPVVAAGDTVIWIPGFKPARRFAARADSKTWVALEARPL
jgi:tRNA(Ile)-lysidine synthase